MQYKALCDLAIVQGGGTTTMELAALNRNFLYFPFEKFLVNRKLTIDENRGIMLNQGMLEPDFSGTSNLGDIDEFLTVSLFRKDEFDIYKKLELQVGPLKGSDANELFKEKMVTFNLPVNK